MRAGSRTLWRFELGTGGAGASPDVANGRLRHMLIGYASRLEDRRLPVAGPAARRPADGRPRRGQPLPRLRLWRSRRPARTRQLPARPADGQTCSWSGSSTGWAGTSPTWSTPCRTCRPAGWACGYSPARGRRSIAPPANNPLSTGGTFEHGDCPRVGHRRFFLWENRPMRVPPP